MRSRIARPAVSHRRARETNRQLKSLTSKEVSKITSKLEEYPLEGELVRQVKENILRLQRVGTYRGLRHQKNLPVRGQRTRSNARTKRGKRRTVGAFKKEILSQIKVGKTEEEKK